jgi:hypothetical protein
MNSNACIKHLGDQLRLATIETLYFKGNAGRDYDLSQKMNYRAENICSDNLRMSVDLKRCFKRCLKHSFKYCSDLWEFRANAMTRGPSPLSLTKTEALLLNLAAFRYRKE